MSIGSSFIPRFALALLALAGCAGSDGDGKAPGADDGSGSVVIDLDGDGVAEDDDCDDGDATVSPAADERCDGRDNDCDGLKDEEDAVDTSPYFRDADGDGYGDTDRVTQACSAPVGSVPVSGDCDDANDAVYPDAPERCDGLDQDCDDLIDEAVTELWFEDQDGDGYGDPTTGLSSCDPGEGYVADGSDCDDAEPAAFPGNPERCDGLDNDCDGALDEAGALDAPAWYTDADLDGYGDPATERPACAAPEGAVAAAGDCDDLDPDISPAALERCDLEDNDCDSVIDEDDATDAPLWYLDLDGDLYGDPATAAPACSPPLGAVADDQDCDDLDPDISPAALERCDLEDNDCDDTIDEADAIDAADFYLDLDLDGYGGSTVTVGCSAPEGSVAEGGDCDDSDPTVSPGLVEVCDDGKDNTCDGTDDGCRLDGARAVASAAATLEGQGSFDRLSSALLLADLDGDGQGDAVAGSRTDDDGGSGSGAAFFFAGPLSGSRPATGAVAYAGEAAGDAAGTALGAGDVDGDGFLDLLVGAPDADTAGSQAGAAYLLFGPLSADLSLSLADSRLRGEDGGDQAGSALGLAGDLDGDGLSELVIGAPFEEEAGASGGAVYLFSAPAAGELGLAGADSKLVAESAGDEAGAALDSRGDLDGDGLQDLVIGAPSEDSAAANAGAVYLFYQPGSGTLSLSVADSKLQGTVKDDTFGAAVATVGDVDGDGTDDLLVGAPGEDSAGSAAGAAYLFTGPLSGTLSVASAEATVHGGAAGDEAGGAVAGAGDVDGDGGVDLLLGGPGASGGAGRVWLLYGPVSGVLSLSLSLSGVGATVEGEAGSELGVSLAPGEDADGDGFSDLLLGAESASTLSGRAYLFGGSGGW
jgi:hypothetical protein